MATGLGFMLLFVFQNCEYEVNGNGGGYTGFQEEHGYGAFDPGHSVLLPNFGEANGGNSAGQPSQTVLRDYYFFSESTNCNGTVSTAQQGAAERVSFIGDDIVRSDIDCGNVTASQGNVAPITSSYNPWFVVLDGKIYQLLNDDIAPNATPFTYALCRQVNGTNTTNPSVDYGWDVVIQNRGGVLDATIIRGRQDTESDANLRKIWQGIQVDEDSSNNNSIDYVGINFELQITRSTPLNNTLTSGFMRSSLDGRLTELNMDCWLQNQ